MLILIIICIQEEVRKLFVENLGEIFCTIWDKQEGVNEINGVAGVVYVTSQEPWKTPDWKGVKDE